MRLSVDHLTTYRYEGTAQRSTQYVRLTPVSSRRQRVIEWHLDMPGTPRPGSDSFGNQLHVLTLDQPHREIAIRAWGEVEVHENEDPAGGAVELLSPLVYRRHTRLTRPSEAMLEFARRHAAGAGKLRDVEPLEALMHGLLECMPYSPGATHVASTASEAFAQGQGVCQDHTHVFIACARSLGFAARYVSGYLYSDDPGHVASHAWAEVWTDDSWHTFDVTNAARDPSHHLKLAVGLDYLDACPVRGVRTGGGTESLATLAQVRRRDNDEPPLASWQEIPNQ